MRKIILSILILSVSIYFISCKSETKNDRKKVTVENKFPFSLNKAKHKIEWVAYKTTEKIPVKGKFKKINITAGGDGNSIKEAMNNAKFSIPISSIFTLDTNRDFKIRKNFFGVMDATKLVSGTLIIENDSVGYADITMNGVTAKLPFLYTIKNRQFSMSAKMNLLNWNAQNAIDSLNVICKDLHKGTDGVSKTWSEVAIQISSTFN